MAHTWDPDRYLSHADERGRPFVELLARIPAEGPHDVVDLGCGPGNLTALLAQRWPTAHVAGIDASAEMVARARQEHPQLHWAVQDVREWLREEHRVGVLVSNATLQWVPGHLDLLGDLVSAVRPVGWLGFQVPGNFGEPSHVIRRELAAEAPYAEHLDGVVEPGAHDAATYLHALQDLGCSVDAWETTYLHVLTGPDPVYHWIEGTSLRPMLQRLPDELAEQFGTELRRRLAAAYPDDGRGVVLPFRRVFVVARTPADRQAVRAEAPGVPA